MEPINTSFIEREKPVPKDRNNVSTSTMAAVDEDKFLEAQGDDEQSVQEDTINSSDNVTACLQVLGAFFLMFNSWYFSIPALRLIHFLSDITQGNCKHFWSLSNILRD
jgi:hypothetical protein